MSLRFATCCVLACGLFAAFMPPGVGRAEDPPKRSPGDSEKANELKALLEERHKLLRQAADQLLERYKAGTDNIQKVVLAEREALKAALDLSEKPEDRLAALKKCLALVSEAARMTELRVQAGQALESDFLQARAALLELKIELLREETKAKPRK